MSKLEILKKLYLYKKNPNLYRDVSNSELADLVLTVMGAVKAIDESIESKRLDIEGKYDKQAGAIVKDLELTTKQLLKEVTAEVNRMINTADNVLSETSSELEKRVAEAIANIRNGENGIVTEEEIERAATMASLLIELPNFDALVTEALTANATATRDGLESLVSEEDKLKIEAIGYLRDELDELRRLIGTSVVGGFGGVSENRVRQLIAELGGGGSTTFLDLTDTPSTYTGQAGKFAKVNAGEDGLEFGTIAGGGDMLSSNNLSDVADVATARTNLGLGDVASTNDYNDLDNLPDLSVFDEVEQYTDLASFPGTGNSAKFYLAQDTGIMYRWTGSAYAEISAQLALGETSSTAYRGDRGKTAYDHSQLTSGNPHNTAISDISGLSTVLDAKSGNTKSVDQDYAGYDIRDVGLAGFKVNAIGNSSTSFNIDWNGGAYQSLTLTGNASVGTQTAPSGDSANGWRLQLDVIQDGTGGRDFTPPSNWVFPEGEPTWTAGTANQRIIITAMYNGTNYVCTATSWFTNP